MDTVVKPLSDIEQTGETMYYLVDNYYSDLDEYIYEDTPVTRLPLQKFYDLIKALPYKEDQIGIEVISRPAYMLDNPFSGWDCKKKSIAIASYLRSKNIPYRFSAVSSRPDKGLHHVVVDGLIDNEWVEIDATYPHNQLFSPGNWTAKTTLPLQGDYEYIDGPKLVALYGNTDESKILYDKSVSLGIAPVLVAAIISAVAATGTTAANLIAKKRQQERQAEHEQETAERENIVVSERTEQALKLLSIMGLGLLAFWAVR